MNNQMEEQQLVRLSKFLSKHLRHDPRGLGLTLGEGGWVEVSALLDGASRKGVGMTRPQLDEIVARNNKQRFSFDESGTRIRANQGHSVEVDLQLTPQEPPSTLYHGTPERSVEVILQDGLRKMKRHHVHLSLDVATATNVGARRGRPVILEVDAAAMHAAGFEFFRSDNGVWLVERVPAEFIRRL
jgi:putative RNA 2'-phosphotransferase